MGLTTAPLSAAELVHYTSVAASAELRRAKAVLPRELIDADEWLSELQQSIARELGSVSALLLHPKKDGLSSGFVRRLAQMFPNNETVPLPRAGHFFQEDAAEEVATAIARRFAVGSAQSQRALP
jgi:pimeloyl-ACP methyl ester carboxylesterase